MDTCSEVGRQRDDELRAVRTASSGPWTVGGQLQLGEPGEALRPVDELRVEVARSSTAPLHAGKVGLLCQEVADRPVTTTVVSVELGDLGAHHAERPLIGHDVMHAPIQHVDIASERVQRASQQGQPFEIEQDGVHRAASAPSREPASLRPSGSRRGSAFDLVVVLDHLPGTGLIEHEPRPQRLVTCNQHVEGG